MDTKNIIIGPENYFSVTVEAGYVVDFQKQGFSCVANHDMFCCGYSPDEIVEQGYSFYYRIAHKDDWPLLPKIHKAVLNSDCIAEKQENIDYFSFTFRIRVKSQKTEKPYYIMAVHRLHPVFSGGELVSGVCMMNISAMKTSGNLRVYFKGDRQSFNEYSFESRRWHAKQDETLTEQEMKIIILSKEGLDSEAIANELKLKYKTVCNKKTEICKKFNMDTIEQVIVYLTNHLRLFEDVNEKDKFM
jgi:DNA-binding CsgD family transcriptional regulator